MESSSLVHMEETGRDCKARHRLPPHALTAALDHSTSRCLREDPAQDRLLKVLG